MKRAFLAMNIVYFFAVFMFFSGISCKDSTPDENQPATNGQDGSIPVEMQKTTRTLGGGDYEVPSVVEKSVDDPRIVEDAKDDINEDPSVVKSPYPQKGFNSSVGLGGNIGGGNGPSGKGGVVYRKAYGGSISGGSGSGGGSGTRNGGFARKPASEKYPGTEEYDSSKPNEYTKTAKNNFSTFSIDVDTASYSIVRKKINSGEIPTKEAVRPEEFLNYFDYGYEKPKGDELFAVHTEIAKNPYNAETVLMQVGLQAKKLLTEKRKPLHLTFLVDVSGSMGYAANRLPMVKKSLRFLIDRLGENDTVALCTYADSSKKVLEPTKASNRSQIHELILGLTAGGSTAGAAGLKLAYELAEESFSAEHENRIILCSDGDFNVGERDPEKLIKMIESKAKKGITLSILGFGIGNYKDERFEKLSNKGNGNYYFIDTISEARRVFGKNLAGTMQVLAADVKLQVEFDADLVEKYRLIGYENRTLTKEQFRDDKVDAGEIGDGQRVTAMYEIILKNSENDFDKDKLAVVRLRYKKDINDKKAVEKEFVLRNQVLKFEASSKVFKFATAVVGFADSLRQSTFAKDWRLTTVLEAAEVSEISDVKAKAEFIDLVRKTISLRDK